MKSVEELLGDTGYDDEQSKNFNTEIQRLRNQVSTIANRYKETGDGNQNRMATHASQTRDIDIDNCS